MKGLRVKKRDAEKVKKILIKNKILDNKRKVKRDRDYVIFPISCEKCEVLKSLGEIVEEDFEPLERKNLYELVYELTGKKLKFSFDIIGNIAIVEIPEESLDYKHEIAEALLTFHKLKAVYRKASEVYGRTRIRKLEFLFGKNESETIHKEHGILLKLDVKKVYFSPRLSFERKRILDMVKDGELIVDMFSGVGPFSILIAKNRDVKIYAIDINPWAVYYLRQNIELNKVENKVVPILADCSRVNIKGADRVIMNLPKESHLYLEKAIEYINKAGFIHFYTIYENIEDILRKLREKDEIKILNKRKVKEYAPRKYIYVFDLFVEKM